MGEPFLDTRNSSLDTGKSSLEMRDKTIDMGNSVMDTELQTWIWVSLKSMDQIIICRQGNN